MNWTELFTSWQKQYNNGDTDISYYDISIENKDNLVICLGDSWTWGDSLGDQRTQRFYAQHLANYYQADFINAGFRGWRNSWILMIGKLLVEKVKTLDYKKIIVVVTLTENGRDVWSPMGFDFDYIAHFNNNGVTAQSYEMVLTKIQLCWQNQIEQIIAEFDNRFQLFVGQNFVWHDFYSNLEKNPRITTTNLNWIELLADHQNISRPIRTNLVTGWIFDRVNHMNSMANIKDTSVYKEWIIPYIEKAQLVNQWLDASELNHKEASKHPTALAHKLWAEHIVESLKHDQELVLDNSV